MIIFCYQIIDQYTNISLRTIDHDLLTAKYFQCCVDSCHKTLTCCFFIPGASIKLSTTEQSFNCFKLQCRIQLSWIDAIILDCVCIFHNFSMLQSWNRMIHIMLYIFWKRTRHTAHIHLIRKKSFWLNKYLMTIFICKSYYLILNRRTISRTSSFNISGIQR